MIGTLRKAGVAAALSVSILFAHGPVSAAPSCEWPDEVALQAILPVATDHGSHASGVVVAPNRVLTAAHALNGGQQYFVRIDGGFRKARLIMKNAAHDLAVLDVNTDSIKPLPISAAEPSASQMVWAVGFPRAQGKTTSSGVFQKNRQGALHTSAPIDSGQSGGGLLSCERGHYELLGMLRGYGAYLSGNRYVKLQNHSVAVAATTIHRFVSAFQ